MESGQPAVRVAFLGHEGHGKTALVEAVRRELLAGQPPIEPRRSSGGFTRPADGAPRDPVRVHIRTVRGERCVAILLDCPGARRQVRHVGRALLGVDVAVLVVAADRGVEAQTLEHLQLAHAMGVERVIVFVSLCDRVEPDDIALVEWEAREAVSEVGHAVTATVLRGAAPPGDAGPWAPTWRDLIEAIEQGIPARALDADGPTLLSIEDRLGMFPVEGDRGRVPGQLVGAVVRRGRVRAGQTLSLLSRSGAARPVVVRSLEVGLRACEEAGPGQEVGLLLAPQGWSIGRGDFRRDTLCAPGTYARARVVECSLRLLTTPAGGRWTPLFHGHRPYAFLAHDGLPVTLELPAEARPEAEPFLRQMAPGERLDGVRLRLPWGAAIGPGDRFALSDGSDALGRAWGGGPRWYGMMAAGTVTRVLEVERTTG